MHDPDASDPLFAPVMLGALSLGHRVVMAPLTRMRSAGWSSPTPVLPRRLAEDAAMNRYDRASFYGGDVRAYTDYPVLTATA